MAAAVGMLDERHGALPSLPHDNNNYTFGRIGDHNVAIACLPAGGTGTISAARVATQMLSTFTELRFGLMVGIGSGVPSEEHDIRLGDVVISQPMETYGGVIQYDFGKTVQEGKFTRTGSLNKPPDVLLAALANLEAKHIMEGQKLSKYLSEMMERYQKMAAQFSYPRTLHDSLYEADYDHPNGLATCSQCDSSRLRDREPRASEDPVIHYGLIASGDQVMRHGATRDRLRRELNVLCFDMEAAGLMDSFPCLVVRGICDYADSHKNKQWQPYAAAAAAAYAKELLYIVPRCAVVEIRPVFSQADKSLREEVVGQKRRPAHPTDESISQSKRMRIQSTDQIGTARPFSQDYDLVGRESIFEGSDDERDDDEEDSSDEGSGDESTEDENTGYQYRIGPCYKCKDFNP
jgi:nucleoside phosphorylase